MYPSAPNNRKQKLIASFVVILAVAIMTGAVSAYEKQQKTGTASNQTATAASQTQPVPQNTPATQTSNSSYRDGTYTAGSEYYVPHGSEDIKVTLTLKGGVVTDSRIVNSENDPESARFQEDFAAEYKKYVVGKNISDVRLSYVAGASDTTDGFNDAVAQIITEAKT